MEIITEVTKSRNVIKEILSEDYDTKSVPDYTEEEIDKLYRIDIKKSNPFSILGYGISYYIHVLYYNFPEIGKSSSKVTKTFIDKIMSLYINEAVKYTDNIIVIINETISETINNMINTLNIQLHNKFNLDETELGKKLKEKNINLQSKHFRFVTLFNVKNLQFNALNHVLVDKHIIIRNTDEINKILKKCNSTIDQLPVISQDDAIGKLKLIRRGDLCKIERTSKSTGQYDYYRVCK
jgi:DNA-directed RNA polymerase subunit H (RpoH/RPB5)